MGILTRIGILLSGLALFFQILILRGELEATKVRVRALEVKAQVQVRSTDVRIESSKTTKTASKVVTAYNSTKKQTDSTPCIAADGTDICRRFKLGEKICAANDIPIGTQIHVPGYGRCTIADRMAKKHTGKIDVYFGKDLTSAKKWGKKTLKVSYVQSNRKES